MKIRTRVDRISAKIACYKATLERLQLECTHPNLIEENKEAPRLGFYWKMSSCPDCDKTWIEERKIK